MSMLIIVYSIYMYFNETVTYTLMYFMLCVCNICTVGNRVGSSGTGLVFINGL